MDFFSALTLLFICLKLTDAIAWSWWLVLSPMLVGVLIFLFVSFFLTLTAPKRRNPYV